MNRYEQTFQRLKAQNETAFIPFGVAGDPDLQTSEAIFKTYIDSGADILEIGYPFSDPIADGPTNQRAGMRAIASGINHRYFFKFIESLRKYTDIPFGLLCYANTVYHLGYDTFCKRAASAGLDSILVADMPPEESDELFEAVQKHNLQSVYIVSELTPSQRLKTICKSITGFVYVVSRLGVTGAQSNVESNVAKTLKKLKKVTDKPLCVGFGLSKPEHITEVKQAGADGAIVGSALVSLVEKNLNSPEKMLRTIARHVKKYKKATE